MVEVEVDTNELRLDSRNAVRLELYEDESESRYPNTGTCDNSDLRDAFVRGCCDGYEAVVLGAPRGMDRLQQDAYMEGTTYGEDAWRADNVKDDDDEE